MGLKFDVCICVVVCGVHVNLFSCFGLGFLGVLGLTCLCVCALYALAQIPMCYYDNDAYDNTRWQSICAWSCVCLSVCDDFCFQFGSSAWFYCYYFAS